MCSTKKKWLRVISFYAVQEITSFSITIMEGDKCVKEYMVGRRMECLQQQLLDLQDKLGGVVSGEQRWP